MESAGSIDRVFVASFEDGEAPDCNTTVDTDGDRLEDCVEEFLGTYADQPDTDSDGIRDGDEVLGTVAGLDLPSLGVDPRRRDLLIEYDWFEAHADCLVITHRPTPAALARVTEMFANAPVVNPDGSRGIHVIHDYGQLGALSGGNAVEGFDANMPGRFDSTFIELKSANFRPERRGYYRYALMAHSYAGSKSSGVAEINGDDFMVTLQNAGAHDPFVALLIAHEVGHNFGLRHGGGDACNGKPNYNSVMNYRFMFSGVDDTCDALPDGRLDYSRGSKLPINEASINETVGVCGDVAIDWNKSGTIDAEASVDLNQLYNSTCGATHTELHDFDDWTKLAAGGLGIGLANGKADVELCDTVLPR